MIYLFTGKKVHIVCIGACSCIIPILLVSPIYEVLSTCMLHVLQGIKYGCFLPIPGGVDLIVTIADTMFACVTPDKMLDAPIRAYCSCTCMVFLSNSLTNIDREVVHKC